MKALSSSLTGLILSVSLGLVGCGGGGGGGGGSNPPPQASSAPVVSSVATEKSSSVVSSSSFSSSTLQSSLAPSSSSALSSSSVPSSSSAPSSEPVSTTSVSSSSSSSVVSSSQSSSSSLAAKVTVRGVVVGEAMVGAGLDVNVGSRTYKTTVNDQNQFQVSVDIEASSEELPISAIATGASSNSWIQLAALWPSASQLKVIAGEDGVLDASEFLGVNISPLTTADYAHIKANQATVLSDTDRQYALLTQDLIEKLNRAAYLERVLNDISTALPASYVTTLAMMVDREYLDSRIKILKADNDLMDNEIESILNDANQNKLSTKPFKGEYLLSWGGIYYLLDFNENGTGYLLTSNSPGGLIYSVDAKPREGTFSWVKKGTDIKVTLDAPINYGKASAYVGDCSGSASNCEVKLVSLLLNLMSDGELGKIAQLSLNVSYLNLDTQITTDVVRAGGMVSLLDRSKFYQPALADIQGMTWETGLSSYIFASSGVASITDQLSKTTNQVNWALDDGVIHLDGGKKFLLPIVPTEYGFQAIELLEQSTSINSPNALQKVMVVKQQNVAINSEDWSGRWQRVAGNSFVAAFDYYSDGDYRDGFETKSFGSWVATSGYHLSGLAGGSWRMEYDLLAIHDGERYVRYCYGYDAEQFKPINCIVESYIIDKTFTGNIFWEVWSRPFFQDGTGREWRFWGHQLMREGEFLRNYDRVGVNLLYDKTTGMLLELRSSDLESIELCEYSASSSCESGNIHRLTRGLEITINRFANGLVRYSGDTLVNSISDRGGFLAPRGKIVTLEIVPQNGYTITANNITGCDGTLSGTFYTIPARQTDCEITLNLAP